MRCPSTNRLLPIITVAILIAAGHLNASPVAKRAVKAIAGRELLRNGGLEQAGDGRLEGWSPYGEGYAMERSVAHGGQHSAACDAPQGGRQLGLSQTLTLDRTDARPLVVSAWSKAEGVAGGPNPDYSLYVDLIYQDGTPLWGQIAGFSSGTHDWEYRRVQIFPTRPIKSLTVHLLFRGRQGKVWFDDVSLQEASADGRYALFDGACVEPSALEAQPPAGQAQILVRDAAAESDFYQVRPPAAPGERVDIPELKLAVEVAQATAAGDSRRTRIAVRDLAGRDRAVTLYYVVPVDATGWRWYDNVRESRVIGGRDEYHNTVQLGVGGSGRTSRYPFACVAGEREARSLLVTEPAVCHFGYNAGTRELYAAFDVGLASQTRVSGSANVSVIDARTDPQWGLRDTARLFYALLPAYFDPARISRPQGNWMAFQAISSVQDPEDFGFAVHEGDNDVRWDNDHGVGAYVYVEPMTWWLPMPKEMPRTYEAVMQHLEACRKDPQLARHDLAWAVSLSGIFDRTGRYNVDLLDTPWCDGAVFGNSADPDVPERDGHANLAHLNLRNLESALKRAEAHGGLAGIYLDSLEGWGRLLNHRREHFAAASLPLTFDSSSFSPVILNAMATQEWTEFIQEWVRQRGKRLMANAVPHELPYLALPLDLLGTETNWQQDGRFAPPSPDYLYLKRTLAWHKPYMFLMNTHFESWTAEMTERYMRLCLFYGMFPGFFSENASTNCYFANPTWYNRDRPLFRRYMPIIRRVAEAGWEPLTLARADAPDVWLERWGTQAGGGSQGRGLFLTILNTATRPCKTTITLDALLGGNRTVTGLLSSRNVGSTPRFEINLPPGDVEVLEIRMDE